MGAKILKTCKVLSVDVHNPDCELYVDVRREGTYIFRDKIKGFGGLPLGTNGKGLILMSGGIDSPVAAFMMAKTWYEDRSCSFPFISLYQSSCPAESRGSLCDTCWIYGNH